MVPHLYVQALLRDPILAEMIKAALDDGQILAWTRKDVVALSLAQKGWAMLVPKDDEDNSG